MTSNSSSSSSSSNFSSDPPNSTGPSLLAITPEDPKGALYFAGSTAGSTTNRSWVTPIDVWYQVAILPKLVLEISEPEERGEAVFAVVAVAIVVWTKLNVSLRISRIKILTVIFSASIGTVVARTAMGAVIRSPGRSPSSSGHPSTTPGPVNLSVPQSGDNEVGQLGQHWKRSVHPVIAMLRRQLYPVKNRLANLDGGAEERDAESEDEVSREACKGWVVR
ncbi:hypothetical protein DFH08DRAFT_859613 [Mycena albidolilacea]|uniref:Uncharacterized protein n=1 Tax=Mycena albidolilacea TaxID=1033008 RepID=A0AAD7EWD3_9AGAR|nr:hypothetical protein DFH08DRAFT_859613 [Mycena albidolilacea]